VVTQKKKKRKKKKKKSARHENDARRKNKRAREQEREREREREKRSLEARLMDGRLHQSDKRDSLALFSLALILLLFYLISETRAEKRRRAVRR